MARLKNPPASRWGHSLYVKRAGGTRARAVQLARIQVQFMCLSALVLAGFSGLSRAQGAPSAPSGLNPASTEAPSAVSANEDSAFQRLRRAQNRFEFGDCEATLAELEGLDAPQALNDEKQSMSVHQLKGICLALQGEETRAAQQFERLLYIAPEHELDAFRTPPAVMELFENTKKRIREEIARLQEARAEQEQQAQPEALRVVWVEREIERQKTPFAAVFLPFGLSQWTNREPSKALIIGGIQLAAMTANIGTYWAMQGIKSVPQPSASQQEAYRWLQSIQAGALIATIATYFYGVGDAWWNHEPSQERLIAERRKELQGEEARESLRRLTP